MTETMPISTGVGLARIVVWVILGAGGWTAVVGVGILAVRLVG